MNRKRNRTMRIFRNFNTKASEMRGEEIKLKLQKFNSLKMEETQ